MSPVKLYGGPADGETVLVHDELSVIRVTSKPKIDLSVAPSGSSKIFRALSPIYCYRRDVNHPEFADYIPEYSE